MQQFHVGPDALILGIHGGCCRLQDRVIDVLRVWLDRIGVTLGQPTFEMLRQIGM